MKKSLVVLLFLWAPFATCWAELFVAEGISLAIPKGFVEKFSQVNKNTSVYIFTKASSGKKVNTLLQMNVFDMGSPVPKFSTEKMWEISDKYLLEFLKGIEDRRVDFRKSKISHIFLGEVAASKVSWNGEAYGIQANGVMYCVIVGSKVISLHTQDSGVEMTLNMSDATKSIESLTLARKN